MRDRRGRWGWLLVTLLVGVVACRSGEPGGGEETAVPEWAAELELRIGSLDDPGSSLTAVRGLEVGPDGSVYTLHPSEAIVRHFDADGNLVRVFGGRGGGPGELRRARLMGMVGDTLWVMDGEGYRISRFMLDGTFVGSFQVPFDMGSADMTAIPPRPVGLLSDGTVYGQPPGISDWLADGRLTDQVPVLMTRDGRVTDVLPAMPYRHLVWAIPSPDGRGGSYAVQPFEDRTAFAFDLNRRALVVLDREPPANAAEASFTVMKLEFDGDTLFSRAFAFDPIPVRQEELDSALDAFAAEVGERRLFGLTETEARRLAEETLYAPAYRPGARYVVPGRDDTIWVMLEPGDADTATWLVLDSGGEPMGRVRLPSGVLVRQAELPLVWGVETDELDVPYVVRYRVSTSMIGTGSTGVGATLAEEEPVTPWVSQGSRNRGHGPSTPIPAVL